MLRKPMGRRAFIRAGMYLGAAGATLAGSSWTSPLFAKSSFPTGPIDVIVPFGVGGGTDIWVRAIASGLADKQHLNTPINVRNLPGAASLRGTVEGMQAAPDGYTLTAFNPPSTPFSAYITDAPFDITKFRGISVYVREPGVIIASPNAKFKDLRDLVAAYKSGEETVIASEQKGTMWNVAALLLKRRSNVDWKQYISYSGTADVIAAVLRDEVPAGIVTASSALDASNDGRLDPLAMIGVTERISSYPNVPTLDELGMDPLTECLMRRAVYAPPDISEERRAVLEKAWIDAQGTQSAQTQYKAVGLDPARGDGAEAEKAVRRALRTAKELNLRSIAG